jgi:hypothetical protein
MTNPENNLTWSREKRMEKPRRIKGKTVSGKGKVKTVVTEN